MLEQARDCNHRDYDMQMEPNSPQRVGRKEPFEASMSSPRPTKFTQESSIENCTAQVKMVQRNEFTKSIKNSNFSPMRRIANSNNRLSFLSESPTRCDEIASSHQSSKLKLANSPFEPSPDAIAHSEHYGSNGGKFDSATRIKKQTSSDIKAIKISKLIDFHREIE